MTETVLDRLALALDDALAYDANVGGRADRAAVAGQGAAVGVGRRPLLQSQRRIVVARRVRP